MWSYLWENHDSQASEKNCIQIWETNAISNLGQNVLYGHKVTSKHIMTFPPTKKNGTPSLCKSILRAKIVPDEHLCLGNRS